MDGPIRIRDRSRFELSQFLITDLLHEALKLLFHELKLISVSFTIRNLFSLVQPEPVVYVLLFHAKFCNVYKSCKKKDNCVLQILLYLSGKYCLIFNVQVR